MSRLAIYGYEELYNEETGKIKGVNFGYGFYSEHECGYNGEEFANFGLEDNKNDDTKNDFEKSKIKDASSISLFEQCENVVLTNAFWMRSTAQNPDEFAELIKRLKEEDRDKIEIQYYPKEILPPVDTYWNEHYFIIVSSDPVHNKMLKQLYDEIVKGNVAISDGFETLFSDRGLSFVMLDQLTMGDLTFDAKDKSAHIKSRNKGH